MDFIIELIFIFIGIIFLSIRYLKYRKFLVKNIFKDQFFVLLVILLMFFPCYMLTIRFMSLNHSSSTTSNFCAGESITGVKKIASTMNQALDMSIQLEEKNASTCKGCTSNAEALANFIMPRINFIASYNISTNPEKVTKEMASKIEKSIDLAKLNKTLPDELLGKPMFLINDGSFIIFEKVKGKCGEVQTFDPRKANCVVTVDINGIKSPNKFSTGNNTNNDYKFNDRYRVIVMKNTVEPAQSKENDSAWKALNH